MKILAIETSTASGSLALWEGDEIVLEEDFYAPRGHSTAIFDALEKVLEVAGSSFDVIVVGTGPGSYSGVRVGVTAANALGITFGTEAWGVPSLLGPMETVSEDYTVVGDARRGSYFVARVRGGRLVGEIDLCESAVFAGVIAKISDEGEIIITFDEHSPEGMDPDVVAIDSPSAGCLAALVAVMSEAETRALGERSLEPIYLRAPYITTPKRR